jgi:RimJ/RimL family protein N-acetyltransferase
VSSVDHASQRAIASAHRDRRKTGPGFDEITLADGARVWVRRLEPADRHALTQSFERLSDRSRIQRFLGPKRELTDHDLTQFLYVDHVRREALVAIDPANGSIVGVGRYCMWPQGDNVAELAGEIVDDWQGRGIGRELLARIIERAGANEIRKLTASAFSDNAAALALLKRAGFTTNRCGYGVSELQLELRDARHEIRAPRCSDREVAFNANELPQKPLWARWPTPRPSARIAPRRRRLESG